MPETSASGSEVATARGRHSCSSSTLLRWPKPKSSAKRATRSGSPKYRQDGACLSNFSYSTFRLTTYVLSLDATTWPGRSWFKSIFVTLNRTMAVFKFAPLCLLTELRTSFSFKG